MSTANKPIPTAIGHAIDECDMHWTVDCPGCGKEHEYEGWFDAEDDCLCPCGITFRTVRVWITETRYIK